MNTQIALYNKIENVSGLMELGSQLYQSGMLNLTSEAAGSVVALTCVAEGITPLEFLRKYHIIQNRPSMRSDAMLAEWRMNHGGRHMVVESSADRAAIRLIDKDGNESDWELTWEEAKQSPWPWRGDGKTLKDNWATPMGRRDMLWARLVSFAIRRTCPEINSGIYTPEEVMDIEPRSAASVPAYSAPKQDPDDVVEGEYEAVEEVQPHSEEEPEEKVAGEPEEPAKDHTEIMRGEGGFVTKEIVKAIEALYDDLGITQQQKDHALRSRQVGTLMDLRFDEGNAILKKLRELEKQLAKKE